MAVNFSLTTTIGDTDLLGEVADGETYHTLLRAFLRRESFRRTSISRH